MPLNYDQTLVDVFETACKEFPRSIAFSCMGQELTYQELYDKSTQFAAYLQNATDLRPGDRIAVQLPNILQYPVVVFGAIRAGIIVVNVNPLYTAHELTHQLKDSGAKVLVVLANIATAAAQIINETDIKKVIVTELADFHPPVKRLLINSVVKYVKKMVPKFHFDHAINLRQALTHKYSFSRIEVGLQDVAVLQYTGGTTGVAKGAMLTHRNLVANMVQVNTHMSRIFTRGDMIYIAPLPLYHIYAFTIHCTSALSFGSHNVLIPNPRDIDSFMKVLKTTKFTCFVGLNTLFNALLRHPDFGQLDFSHIRLTSSGGMALTAETFKRWTELTGSPISEGYGLTETSPVVSINPPDAIQQGTVGVLMVDTECKVIGDHGETLANGEPGELCIRGPQVMKGYWQRPEATDQVIDADGWFKSGDIAVIQDDGYIRIVDRIKDMINISGFKVFPNEVEDVLSSHPDILEVAVVGVTGEDGSEIVKAFVVPARDDLTVKEVRDFAKQQLTPYKVPHQVEFRKELPKSNVGKVLRRELKE